MIHDWDTIGFRDIGSASHFHAITLKEHCSVGLNSASLILDDNLKNIGKQILSQNPKGGISHVKRA